MTAGAQPFRSKWSSGSLLSDSLVHISIQVAMES